MAGNVRPGVARGGNVRSLKRKRRRRLKKRMAFFPPSTVSVYAVPK
jgi:hypothetical protein